jgi:mRNA interferase MazF
VPEGTIPDEGEGLAAGDVVSAFFPEHIPGGHEQQGLRPAVVGVPERLGEPRFEVLVVVPMTTDRDQEWSKRSS